MSTKFVYPLLLILFMSFGYCAESRVKSLVIKSDKFSYSAIIRGSWGIIPHKPKSENFFTELPYVNLVDLDLANLWSGMKGGKGSTFIVKSGKVKDSILNSKSLLDFFVTDPDVRDIKLEYTDITPKIYNESKRAKGIVANSRITSGQIDRNESEAPYLSIMYKEVNGEYLLIALFNCIEDRFPLGDPMLSRETNNVFFINEREDRDIESDLTQARQADASGRVRQTGDH